MFITSITILPILQFIVLRYHKQNNLTVKDIVSLFNKKMLLFQLFHKYDSLFGNIFN